MEFKGINNRSILNFQLASYNNDQKIFSSDLAEKIIIAASLEGKSIEDSIELIDFNTVVSIADQLDIRFVDEFEKMKKRIEDENNDRIDVKINSLKMHLNNQLENLNKVYQSHLKNKSNMAAATKGKMDILQIRIKREISNNESKRDMQSSFKKICVGIIEVFQEKK